MYSVKSSSMIRRAIIYLLCSRYFFKTLCQEFESGVVNEEVSNDGDMLPLFEGKIVGKVERMS